MSPRTYIISIFIIGAAIWLCGKATASPAPARWDLSRLYSSDEAWETDFQESLNSLKLNIRILAKTDLKTREGLTQALNRFSASKQQVAKLYSYASLRLDEDIYALSAQHQLRKAQALRTQFTRQENAFKRTITALGEETVYSHLATHLPLQVHRIFLKKVFSQATTPASNPALENAQRQVNQARKEFSTASSPKRNWPVTLLSNGEAAFLSPDAYNYYKGLPNPDDRTKTTRLFLEALAPQLPKFAEYLNQSIKGQLSIAEQHGFTSSLDFKLSQDQIPHSAYTQLLKQFLKLKPFLKRYAQFKSAYLKFQKLQYEDLTADSGAPSAYDLQTAKKHTLAALRPLGNEYLDTLKLGFSSNWMDVYPRPGKRKGAYALDAHYGTAPYILLNFSGNYRSLRTFVHEWGHAAHSVLSQAHNPYETARYSRITAEIVATTNEILLQDYLIKTATADAQKLYYIERALFWIYHTFFVHTQKTSFEEGLHNLIAQQPTISYQTLNQLYISSLNDYLPSSVNISDVFSSEWATDPTLYEGFTSYRYAIAVVGGSLLSQQITSGDQKRYLALLKAGGSDVPKNLLLKAGLDLTSPAPYSALINRLDYLLKLAETVLSITQN